MAGEVHVRVTRRTPVFVVLDTDVDTRQRQEELSMTRTHQQQCFGMTTEQGIDRYRATEAPAIIWVEARQPTVQHPMFWTSHLFNFHQLGLS